MAKTLRVFAACGKSQISSTDERRFAFLVALSRANGHEAPVSARPLSVLPEAIVSRFIRRALFSGKGSVPRNRKPAQNPIAEAGTYVRAHALSASVTAASPVSATPKGPSRTVRRHAARTRADVPTIDRRPLASRPRRKVDRPARRPAAAGWLVSMDSLRNGTSVTPSTNPSARTITTNRQDESSVGAGGVSAAAALANAISP